MRSFPNRHRRRAYIRTSRTMSTTEAAEVRGPVERSWDDDHKNRVWVRDGLRLDGAELLRALAHRWFAR